MVGTFGPNAVQTVAYEQHIPTTFMFMGSYGEAFEYSFTEMGGLRIINDYTSTPVAVPVAARASLAGATTRPSLPRRNSDLSIATFVPARSGKRGVCNSYSSSTCNYEVDTSTDARIHCDLCSAFR